jgi:hypothetical protein
MPAALQANVTALLLVWSQRRAWVVSAGVTPFEPTHAALRMIDRCFERTPLPALPRKLRRQLHFAFADDGRRLHLNKRNYGM